MQARVTYYNNHRPLRRWHINQFDAVEYGPAPPIDRSLLTLANGMTIDWISEVAPAFRGENELTRCHYSDRNNLVASAVLTSIFGIAFPAGFTFSILGGLSGQNNLTIAGVSLLALSLVGTPLSLYIPALNRSNRRARARQIYDPLLRQELGLPEDPLNSLAARRGADPCE